MLNFSKIYNYQSKSEDATLFKETLLINFISAATCFFFAYSINNFLIKDNIHLILKTLIYNQIYIKEDKNEINDIFKKIEESEGEYKYIEIVSSNKHKIVDFNIIQKFCFLSKLNRGVDKEIYSYLEEYIDYKELVIKKNDDFVNFLFTDKILIPITEEFIRFHKNVEKYESKQEDETKIKVIINKINTIKNYYSPLLEKNPKLKLETKNLFYKNE